jgi:hypothetical protein
MAMPPKTASIVEIIKIIEAVVLVTAHSCSCCLQVRGNDRSRKRRQRQRNTNFRLLV